MVANRSTSQFITLVQLRKKEIKRQKHLYVSPPIKPVLQEIKEGFLHHVCYLCRGEKKKNEANTTERGRETERKRSQK